MGHRRCADDNSWKSSALKLFQDTNLIPWPNFLFACLWRRKEYGLAYLVGLFATYYFTFVLAYPLVGPLVVGIATMVAGLFSIVAAVLLDGQMTRPIVVYRRDSGDQVFQDHQRWWVEDAMHWADAFKLEHGNKRVLWIDGIDPESPIPFNPWLADPPVAEIDAKGKSRIPVTGTRVASVTAKMKSVAKIMKYREPTPGETLRQGLMVGALAIGLVAILMGVNRAGEIMGFGP